MKKTSIICCLLAFACLKSKAQANGYSVNTGSSVYTSQTSGATVVTGAGWDNNNYTTTLPFPFIFNGIAYASGATVNINANGFISFGTTPSNTGQNIFSAGADNNVIAALSADLIQESATGTFSATWNRTSYSITITGGTVPSVGTTLSSAAPGFPAGITTVTAVSGNTITISNLTTARNSSSGTVNFAPLNNSGIITKNTANRLYIEWVNADIYVSGTGATGSNLNFGIVLNSDNTIIFYYGQMSAGAGVSVAAAVGLRGSNSSNFLDVSGSWSSPAVSVSNNNLTQILSGSNFPVAGLTYTFTPPTPVCSGTYTIDKNLPASPTNFQSFTKAIAALNACTNLTGNLTFNVAAGEIFTEDVPVITATGTSQYSIVFQKSGSGANPVLQPTGSSGTTDAGIAINGGDYFTFDGIDIIELAGNAVEYGYFIASASANNGAQNNTIKNTNIALDRSNKNSFGIYQLALYNPSNGSANANNNNRYDNLTIKNVFGGVRLYGYSPANPDLNCEVGNTSATAFNIIGDNTVTNAFDIGNASAETFGIKATYQGNIKIFNNEISNVGITGSAGPTIYASGIFLETATGNSFIYNNKVHDIKSSSASASTRLQGIRADVSSGGAATVYNNFVYSFAHSLSSSNAAIIATGIVCNLGSTLGTTNVYFNSVHIAVSNANVSSAAFYTATGATVAKNNIFSNTGVATSSTSKRYAFYYVPGASGTISSDYNDLYVGTGTNNFIGDYAGSDKAVITDWRTASGGDARSRNVIPNFTSATDLHIPNGTTPTELESAGTSIASPIVITTDIDAQTRPGPSSLNGGGTAPDIGADEFDGKPVPLMIYSSSTATQTSAGTCPGTSNVQIIGMQVVTTGSALPLSLTNLVINASGTTSVSNSVASYQVFYTGTGSTFSTSAPVNSAAALATGNITVTPSSALTLSSGTNYFWLVYNVKSTATGSLDAQFNSVTLSSGSTAYTPAVTNPAGSVSINSLPAASIGAAATSICAGSGAGITISSTTGGKVYYRTNTNSNEQNVSLPANNGVTLTDVLQQTTTYTLDSVRMAGACLTLLSNSAMVTVQQLPPVSAITAGGTNAATQYVQVGSTLQLSDATAGGAWTSGSGASVSTAGLVTGVAAGTPTITYTVTDQGSLHCTNSATQAVRVYNPDYVNITSSHNFSEAGNWQISRGDNTYIAAPSAPSATNQTYTSITVQTPLNMDVDFQLPTGKTFTIASGGTMTILPSITFSSLGTVDFGSKLVTVQSTSAGTGAIGQMATPILNATNVTAERFIGSATFATGKRAWRLLTAPVSGQTINNAWQEGLVSATNTPAQGDLTYGTLITGTRQSTAANAAANGFDFWPEIGNANTSIVYYNGGRWNTFSSLIGVKVSDYPAYLLFVRGNRSVEKGAGAFGVTTLRANGSLNQGAKSFSVGGASAYTLVGNPYAAPIDFEKVYSASTNIQPQFLVWNSQNGLYGSYTLVQRNSATSYSTVPNAFTTGSTSANARFLVSGQGFFVQPVSSSGGTLVINEGAKDTTASGGINPYRLSPATDQRLYVNLNLADDTTTTLADGVLARFDATYSAAITSDDVPKQSNFNENIAIETSGASWIVEARPEVAKTDTVHLKLWNETKRSYQLQVKGENFAAALNASTLHAFLQDSYLGTSQELSLSGSITTVAFTVNSDSASQSASRFRIVFQQGTVSALPVTLTSVSAAPQTGGVAVGWTVTNETNLKDYVVERSTDGGSTFTAIATQEAKNNPGAALTSYSSLDAQPQRGDNLYRIRIEGRDGTVSYSKVVKAVWGEESSNQITIAMYPNPVGREGKVSLQLSNLREGTYLVRVYSEGGQTVYQRKISISQGSSTQSEELRIGNRLAGGSYQLRLTDSKGKVVYAHALIIAK